MKKRSRAPHCSHSSHFIKCECGHERQLHADIPEEGKLESGFCTVKQPRRCLCESFSPLPGYTQAQLEHETIPLEGLDTKRLQEREERREGAYGK